MFQLLSSIAQNDHFVNGHFARKYAISYILRIPLIPISALLYIPPNLQ